MFYRYGRGDEPDLQPTKNWIRRVLLYGAYLDGTRYYYSPDVFLFFFSRLLEENPDSDIHQDTVPLPREHIQKRINADGDAMELAIRILACYSLGIRHKIDLTKQLSLQQEDGGWEIGYLCRTGKTGSRLVNRGYTIALAVNAVGALLTTRALSRNGILIDEGFVESNA
ncbi:hypothetical protein VTN00DRAFT_2693 [Thermoascus crustaceus]|uniref:uncharacterized protein n=1 Tax=Thermoascus crustaceus TaxID=5088 RepID=UPI00374469AC